MGKDLYFVSTAEHTFLFFIVRIYLSVLWVSVCMWVCARAIVLGQCIAGICLHHAGGLHRGREQHPKTLDDLQINMFKVNTEALISHWNVSPLRSAIRPQIMLLQWSNCPMICQVWKRDQPFSWTLSMILCLLNAECSFDLYLSSHLCCITVLLNMKAVASFTNYCWCYLVYCPD